MLASKRMLFRRFVCAWPDGKEHTRKDRLAMGLHISSWIIIHWLLVAAWLNPDKGYFATWALAAVLLWWLAWQRHFPAFPKSPPQRMMIYIVFLGSSAMLGIFVSTLTGYLAPLLIIILLVVELRQRARKT